MQADVAHHEGRRRIAVRAAGEHDLLITGRDQVVGVPEGLQAGIRVGMHGIAGHVHRQFRLQPGEMADVVGHRGRQGLAEDHLVHRERIEAVLFQEAQDHLRREIGRHESVQPFAGRAQRGADHVCHKYSLLFHAVTSCTLRRSKQSPCRRRCTWSPSRSGPRGGASVRRTASWSGCRRSPPGDARAICRCR